MSAHNFVAIIFLLIITAGVFLAINNYETPPATVERVDLSTDDLEFLIQRTSCFGPCPIYALHVRGDGSVRFVGEQYTDIIGGIDGAITDDQLFLIASAIEQSNFFEYGESDECTALWTDSPSVSLWVKWRGRERRVSRYLGCKKDPPDPVPELTRILDSIVNTEEWIGDGPKEYP